MDNHGVFRFLKYEFILILVILFHFSAYAEAVPRASGGNFSSVKSRDELCKKINRAVKSNFEVPRLEKDENIYRIYNRIYQDEKSFENRNLLKKETLVRRRRSTALKIAAIAKENIKRSLDFFNFREAESHFSASQRLITNLFHTDDILKNYQKDIKLLVEHAYRRFLEKQSKAMEAFFREVSGRKWRINWEDGWLRCDTYDCYLKESLEQASPAQKKIIEKELDEWNSLNADIRAKRNIEFKRNVSRTRDYDAQRIFGRKADEVFPYFYLHFPFNSNNLTFRFDPERSLDRIFNEYSTWRGNEKSIVVPTISDGNYWWFPDIYAGDRAAPTERHDIIIGFRAPSEENTSDLNLSIETFVNGLLMFNGVDTAHPSMAFPWGVEGNYEITPHSILLYATEVDNLDENPPENYHELGTASGHIMLIFSIGKCLLKMEMNIKVDENGLGPKNFDNVRKITNDLAHILQSSFAAQNVSQTEFTWKVLELEPITSTNINASPDKKDSCRLIVTLRDERGKTLEGLPVSFREPELGRLSLLKAVTDASGHVKVVYMAPTEEELEKLGKSEITIPIEATDVKTGASSIVKIHVRSKKEKLLLRVKYDIIPGHPDYYNRISCFLKAANKPDGSPYKAVITISDGGYGALVRNKTGEKGRKKLVLDVLPNKDYDFYYHWAGPTAMERPRDELVTIEIPELKQKKKVRFSVGIDLMIESIRMKYGDSVFPVIFEPLNIYIRDRFHPKADLVRLFKDFGINLGLKIKQIAHDPVTPDPTQESIFATLLTEWEGTSFYPHVEPVIYDGPMWGIRETKHGDYLICFIGKGVNNRIYVEYPGINVFERGTYQFQARIFPGKIDADPRNNKAISGAIKIKDFPNEAEELLRTVFLPSAEFLISLGERFGLQLAFAIKDIVLDVAKKDVKGAFRDAFVYFWLRYCDRVKIDKLGKADFFRKLAIRHKLAREFEKAKQASEISKKLKEEANLLRSPTLAVYTKTLCDLLTKDTGSKKTSRTKFFKLNLVPDAFAKERTSRTFSEEDVFGICQLALKGAKDYYVVVMKKAGIDLVKASTSAGVELKKAPSKISIKMKDNQRIFEGKKYTVIPVEKNQNLILRLKGTGAQGRLAVITPETITYYNYPHGKWDSVLKIHSSGKVGIRHVDTHIEANDTGENVVTQPPVPDISGIWSSGFGSLTLTQKGNKITGHYTHDHGHIEGTINGNKFTGRWSEAPTYKPPRDAGDCEFVFSKNGKSFSGRWRYGFGGSSWNGEWNGKKR